MSTTRIAQIAAALGLMGSEQKVLQGHLPGLTRHEIAHKRGTSEETVKSWSKSILQKTGSARVTDLVPLATSPAFVLDSVLTPAAASGSAIDATKVISRGGRKLSFRYYGIGNATLLFERGQSVAPFFTRTFPEHLQATGNSIIALSRPGYGETDPHARRDALLETALADAQAVLEQLNIEDVVVAGPSWARPMRSNLQLG